MSKAKPGTKKRQPSTRSHFEFSAGGVVQDGASLLMVKVQNLKGDQVWTFPKGHIEKGETAEEAALREVEEETGFRCRLVKPFDRVQYFFRRDGMLTKKTVVWFLMQPLEKTGAHDADEILETRWMTFEEAQKLTKYKSDKQLLKKLKEP